MVSLGALSGSTMFVLFTVFLFLRDTMFVLLTVFLFLRGRGGGGGEEEEEEEELPPEAWLRKRGQTKT